jgi:hypothetical protein
MRITHKPTAISESLSLFKDNLVKRKKFVKNEFQAYGLELAKELEDWPHRSLYLRLAKTTPREVLEKAFYFVKDQNRGSVKSKAKLFMWKLKQLKTIKIG